MMKTLKNIFPAEILMEKFLIPLDISAYKFLILEREPDKFIFNQNIWTIPLLQSRVLGKTK